MATEPSPHCRRSVRAPDVREIDADVEIVARLERQGFDDSCDDWVKLSGELIKYGYSVLIGALRAPGVAYRMARRHGVDGVRGLAKLPEDLWLDDDSARDVAIRVLGKALPRFHRTLRAGDWSPTGGASLRTFFYGRCLMELPDAYQWWRQRHPDQYGRENYMDPAALEAVDNHVDGMFRSRESDPADVIVSAVISEAALQRLPADKRAMFELQAAGYSYEEIANMSARAGGSYDTVGKVRTALYRARGQVSEIRKGGVKR
jgi:DNA-directed RNA polymerase specialized sigma24 family protein